MFSVLEEFVSGFAGTFIHLVVFEKTVPVPVLTHLLHRQNRSSQMVREGYFGVDSNWTKNDHKIGWSGRDYQFISF